MPLSANHQFSVNALSEWINKIPALPSLIRERGIFKPEYKTTTYVQIEEQEGVLSLVPTAPRGAVGGGVTKPQRLLRTFNMLHLPKNETVRADDVQNLRAFGTTSQQQLVNDLVTEILAKMKAEIELTREHLMFGALQGKIVDADGTTILHDIYQEFNLTRTVHDWTLNDKANVSSLIDYLKIYYSKAAKGEPMTGLLVLVSPEFMETLINHKSVYQLYTRYQDGATYREGNTHVNFKHKGVEFVVYPDEFPSGLKMKADEGIVLPLGTRHAFKEYFAPADMNSTVNAKALPYYATRHSLPHDVGWELRAQSNPLPMLLRPDLVGTIKLS